MIANFEKIRRYNLDKPAFFNEAVKELHQKALQQNKNLLYIQHYLYLTKGNIEELKLQLGIKVTKHPNLPLMIFNYDHVLTPHDSLIGLECRGLVLETETWNVVAKPMYRFFNWGEVEIQGAAHPNMDKTQFDFDNFVTQSKEDGSLMVLFNYKGQWMLNTRSFFLNDVGRTKVVMSGIHEVYVDEVIKVFVDALGEKIQSLNDLDKYLNRECTYCFEFCSAVNKIVRTYEKDTVFLLAIVDNKTFKEANNEDVDKVAGIIGAQRPKDFNLKTFEAIVEAMKEMITKDPSLEGFVIRDKNASRWKIKSPSYFFLHHISYDKMRTPYPKDLVGLILQGEGTELFSILEINGFTAELHEVQKQWKFCEERLQKHWDILQAEFEKVINIENKAEFEKQLETLSTPLVCLIEDLYKANKKTLYDLKEKWAENPELLVDKLFTEEEKRPANVRQAELKIAPIEQYKKNVQFVYKIPLETLKQKDWWKKVEDTNDGLAKDHPRFENGEWVVHCHCGKQMKLFSVPENWYQYKCLRAPHCNYCKDSIVDKKRAQGKLADKGNNAVLTYQCECGLSHRAHQHQKKIDNELKRRPLKGKPLGIPCSDLCLAMRHRVHEEMDKIEFDFKWSRDQIYKEASQILDVNTEYAHVGMLGISQCRKLIEAFMDMRGEDY